MRSWKITNKWWKIKLCHLNDNINRSWTKWNKITTMWCNSCKSSHFNRSNHCQQKNIISGDTSIKRTAEEHPHVKHYLESFVCLRPKENPTIVLTNCFFSTKICTFLYKRIQYTTKRKLKGSSEDFRRWNDLFFHCCGISWKFFFFPIVLRPLKTSTNTSTKVPFDVWRFKTSNRIMSAGKLFIYIYFF